MKKNNTHRLTMLAMFTALILLLALTPSIGYIPLPWGNATTVHIPVIIGALLLGPKSGAFLGGVFGLSSLITNTIRPGVASFVFSPFVDLGEGFKGNFWSLVICFVPRILVGVIPPLVLKLCRKIGGQGNFKDKLYLIIAGVFGALTNTIFVMSFIYIFFGEQYALATNRVGQIGIMVILTTVLFNGVPEAVISGTVSPLAVLGLGKIIKR